MTPHYPGTLHDHAPLPSRLLPEGLTTAPDLPVGEAEEALELLRDALTQQDVARWLAGATWATGDRWGTTN